MLKHSCGTLFRLLILFLSLSLWAQAKPSVVAHRGGTGLGHLNRLATFEKALALGVDALELDIHQSADGHLMVIHDLSLERTFGTTGRVDRMTLAQLRDLGVPTLQDVVDLVDGRAQLVVEVKQPKDGTRHRGIERRLIKLLKDNELLESSLVISFYEDTLRRLHKADPRLSTGFLFGTPKMSPQDMKEKLGVQYAGPHFALATPEFIARCHEAGLKVNTWTVNQEAIMRKLLEADCDSITTNHPDLLLKVLQKGQQSTP